ncbi:MAG: alpha-glucan family phosphorylase [Betaproteobacteria bacterium]|nr:MAG: alpha-glucan family phosphorylase [Betaproteobacteria bacterium]
MLEDFLPQPRIAYFSMEIGLQAEIPTYSGGLGVLAGDTLRTAADLELPMVAVSLVSRRGYFRQTIDAQGRQVEQPDPWEPARFATPLEAKITVPCEGRRIWVGGWLYELQAHPGGRQPVVLLDTDLDENGAADREITHHLYGGDDAYRLKQEIVLGIGGVRMLQALGFEVSHYHMNEGHSALLTLELLRRNAYAPEDVRPGEQPYDVPRVREVCNFTTHTPVEAGHDKFSYDLVARVLGGYFDVAALKTFAGEDQLNMTRLALNLSDYVNGVARRHAETSRRLFPGYRVRAITNGVHPMAWTSPGFVRLYDQHLAGWCHEPELLARADRVPDDALWAAHAEAKGELIASVKERAGVALRPDVPILGFARRMTGYKRPDLLFSDLQRLKAIAARLPFQVVLAGKAHPRDEGGKRLIEALHAHVRELHGSIAVAYLQNYDMALARTLVAGVDVWLNTPLRPLEASGTSGMKAAFNGVPSLSVLDGWWIEGCIEGVTGWAVGEAEVSGNGDDAAALYRKLEDVVLPLYCRAPRREWIAVMKGAICKNASFFNSHRMMRRYVTEAYIR